MKLNSNIWISISIALAVCILTLTWQRSSISAMRTQLNELESTSSQPPSAENKNLGSAMVSSGSVGEQKRQPSIEELMSNLPPSQSDAVSVYKAIPDLLKSFEDYTVEELMAAVDEINELVGGDPSKRNLMSLAMPMLLMAVSEVEPELVFDSLGEGNTLRLMAFTGLAEKDPARALEILETNQWAPREKQQAKAVLVGKLVSSDVKQALAMISANPADISMMSNAVIAAASLNSEVRERLWGALDDEEDQIVREALSVGLVTGALLDEGFTAAQEAFGRVEFTDGEAKLRLVEELAGAGMTTDPAAAIAWIQEVLSEDQASKAIASGIQSWTESDYNAAALWLGEQPPSPQRDQAIGAFATTVARLDPQAAVTWSMEIQDPVQQQRALMESLVTWKKNDPAAAMTWMQENGVTLDAEIEMREMPTPAPRAEKG